MAEALIHIGDAMTNTWRDGDVMLVRTRDGTFSALEHRFPFTVIPLGILTEAVALELEKTGVVYDVEGEPVGGTENNRRKYRIDWRALIARGDGAVEGRKATEQDVLDGKVVEWVAQAAAAAKVR